MNNSPFLSVNFVNVILETLENLNVSRAQALKGTYITEEQISKEHYLIPINDIRQLFENGVEHTGLDPEWLGYICGKNANVNAYGAPGFAALSEQNFGRALAIAEKYMSVVFPAFHLSTEEDEDYIYVYLREQMALTELERKICLCSFLGSARAMINTLLRGNRQVHNGADVRVELPFEKLDFLDNDSLFPESEIVYYTEEASFRLPKEVLAHELHLANRYVADKYIKECDQLLGKNRVHLVTKIREQLMASEYEFPNMEFFANQFHVSSRTLHRLLREEGYSYRTLLKEVKMLRASKLFETTQKSITEVADLLGYSDSSNFTEAFKNTFARTPRAYIKEHNRVYKTN